MEHGGTAGNWYHNVSNQGSGKDADLYNAMNVWNFVPSANHTLTYKGRIPAAFATDGINVVSWGTSQGGCTTANGCLALTALVLNSGEVIIESDITFNNGYTWSTNGTSYDTWEVAADQRPHARHRPYGHGVEPHDVRVLQLGLDHAALPGKRRQVGAAVRAERLPPTTSCIPDGGVTDGSTSCCGYTFGSYTNSDGTFSICASVGPGGCAGSGGVDDTNSSTSCCSGSAVSGSTRCLNPSDYNNGWATWHPHLQ